MKKHHNFIIYLFTLIAASSMPVIVYAQGAAALPPTNTNQILQTNATGSGNQQNKIANLKARATQEITRRINAMNNAITRISNMVKVPSDQKSLLTTEIQTQISSLQSLQTKINNDTDLPTLKTDVQSIITSYRIFALYLPQVHITAASERLLTIDATIATLEAKIQARITAAQNAGNDVTSLNALFADLQAKITDANKQANNAMSTVSSLMPTGYPGNKTILQNAQSQLLIARQDLTGARQDIKGILEGLKSMLKTKSPSTGNPTATAIPTH